MPDPMSDLIPKKEHRPIRSFVRREGRLTKGQQRALNELWDKYGISNEARVLDLNQVFDRNAPKVLEIGFGNGHSLAEMATEHSTEDYLGIEVHRPGVGALLLLIEEYGLKNIRLICDDAVETLKHRIADNSLDRLQLFFPDPWHKKRHHKRRILKPEFVSLVGQKLKHGGLFHLATDWEDYAIQMVDIMSKSADFENTASNGDFVDRPVYRPLTKFEQRGQRLGHGVWDLIYKKN
jgi:tRNA (guanine-N7-)-methyltransferase